MALPNLDETRRQNTILATTAAEVTPVIINNAVNAHAGVALFTGRNIDAMFGPVPMSGRLARDGGGESIEVRVQLAKSTSAKMMSSGYEEFSRDTQDTARVLRANWKLGGSTAILSGKERRENSGMEQIAPLWQYKLDEAVQALVDSLGQQVFNGDGVNELTGLDTLISANDSLQGISGASYANWNSRGLSAKGTAAGSISFTGGSFATTGVDNWIKGWMNASEGGKTPMFTLTTEDIYRFYEGSIAPEIRYTSLQKGEATFETLTFKNKPVFHDSYCTSGVTYQINPDHLYSKLMPGAKFDVTSPQSQEYQDVFSSKVLFQGNLVCDARKYNNKITGQSA